jgi:predicted DNA-binding transcriptional regulator AlpA
MSPLDYGIDPRLRMKDILCIVNFSQAEVYRKIDANVFPRGIRESHRISIYHLSEVKLAIESNFKYDFTDVNEHRK